MEAGEGAYFEGGLFSGEHSISIETKILVKFEMMCVELGAEKLLNVPNMGIKVHAHLLNITQPCCQSSKLRIMTISIKTKVLVKFRVQRWCV